jgi:hypothetical protein
MLESIMTVAADPAAAPQRRPAVVGPRDKALRRVRTCYDHLAGQVAVAMADRMVERAHMELSPDGAALTARGLVFLRALGVDLDRDQTRAQSGGRLFCRPCLDWSERKPHIAGAVGAALCQTCLSQGWLRRTEGTRAVTVTSSGELALTAAFGSDAVP